MRPDCTRRRSRSGTWIAFVTILGAAAAFRLALVALLRNKQTHDVQVFVSWAQLLTRYGNHGLYHHVDTIDHYSVNYPPLFIIVLDVVDAVYLRLVPHGGENVVLLGMLLKIPAIVADLAICCIVFVVIRRWSGSAAALVAVAIAAFAPSTWPISAVWGQVDSICTSFLMAALALTFERKYTLVWSALALAILVKPLPIVLAPLLLMVQFRDRRWSWGLIAGPGCAIVIAYVVSLPFAPTVSLAGVLSWLAGSYASGQSLTDATSVNAYNVWTLWWLVTPDSRLLLGLRLHAWG
ncbi:MAG: hypothetical protein IAI50_00790, partial [Candidatus Eremiobacteraeota bacterium]|nr:hypothetical protein [Candidatus Eremiobacteraeota bacterium]